MSKQFQIYRGLQKPLVYKGFKGKFIYWGLASLLAGLIVGALTMVLVNMYLGAIVLISIIVGGLMFTASHQKKGLHSKSNPKNQIVHQAFFKKSHLNVQKKRV